jgi:hypothetical protein
MTEPTLDTLTRRLDRLERENRLWKLAGMLALTVALMGQTSPARVVEVEKLILRDASGRERGLLHVGTSGPALQLLDEKGRQRVSLETGESREGTGGLPATLSLMDWEGRKRVTIGSGLGRLLGKEVGGEGLTLAGPDGRTTMSLASIPERTHLTLFDGKGDGRAAFTFFLGRARLEFFDGSITNQRAHFDASGLTVSDETGRLQAALSSTSTGAAFLLKDRNGRTLWSVP